jgi:hypothetical protein
MPLEGKTIDSVSFEKNSDTSTVSCWDDITITTTEIFVAPEYGFGAFSALTACIGAVIIFGFFRRRFDFHKIKQGK